MSSEKLPNIILLIMDTVGARRCSTYGHPRETTPGLSRIAQEGMLYQRCFAPSSWTPPSHASLFTGLYPGEHGFNTEYPDFPGNYYALPEVLRGLGYHTLGITSNYIISRACNFNWGFDEFYEMETLFNTDRYYQMKTSVRAEKDNYRGTLDEIIFILKKSLQEKYPAYPLQHLTDRIYRKYWGDCIKKSFYSTERSFRLAKKLLRKYQDKSFFLFINFMEAHETFNPPRRYRHLIAKYQHEADMAELLYEQEIAYLDARILDFYQFLQNHHLNENTMFIITSDHGEAFGEHDHVGHVFSLYNEIIHIPLVVKYPGALGLKGSSAGLVQLHDLFATLLEVTGAPLPVPESSWSLLGPARDLALAENLDVSFPLKKLVAKSVPLQPFMQPCRCVIDADFFKLIEWADGRLELYDLNQDFQENQDLSQVPALAPRAEALKKILIEKLGPFGKNG